MFSSDKSSINVYFAPMSGAGTVQGEWNMLYPNPKNLLQELVEKKNPSAKKNSMFTCPATREKLKKTYSFSCPIDTSYLFNFKDENNPIVNSAYPGKPFIQHEIKRVPSVIGNPHLQLNLFYMLFADEPLLTSFTPPYYHKPGHMTQGVAAPGSYDIGRWFRPFPLEFTLWDMEGSFSVKEGEPIFYAEFITERPIKMFRVKPTTELVAYANSGATSGMFIEKHIPLSKRYKRFKETQMRSLIMKEIEPNIICEIE